MKRLAFAIVLLLFCLFMSNPCAAAYSGGSGTAEDPYQIADANDLLELAATTADYGKCFILTADIDLGGQTFTTAIIAPDTDNSNYDFDGTAFTGTFDGNGHKISNLTCTTTAVRYVGLFGYTYNATIQNLGVENVNITGYSHVGGLVGENEGTLIGCYATGSVSGTEGSYVGGLVGNNNGSLTGCYATGSVSGTEGSYVGGLVGNNNGSLTGCYATGSVSGTEEFYVGGLVGDNSGSLTACYATGSVNGTGKYSGVGGLIGGNWQGTLTACYATGSVSGSSYVGGLVGNSGGAVSQFYACYATGTVAGSSTYIGGLCGFNSSGTISQCYAAGAVTGYSYVGGFCGYQEEGLIQNSFWDTDTSGLATGYYLDSSHPGTIINVVGKTTAEMMTESTFTDAGWDFSNTDGDTADWILSGVEYPHLISEIAAVNPDVVGMTKQDAATALLAANLQTETIYIVNDTIPAGQVISQSPAVGTEIPCGSIITLTVSIGPKYTGSGTEVDPYRIATKYELLVLSVTPADYGSYFVLTADIDMTGETFTTAIIAPDTTDNEVLDFIGMDFTGVFDGDGYKITNFVINGGSNDYLGLFGQIGSGGQVKSLGVENCSINGTYDSLGIGGLVGRNNGTLSHCYSTNTVAGDNCCGGLVGWNRGSISNCYSTGDIGGEDSGGVGGLVGYADSGSISNCYSTGMVIGSTGVGGLVGDTWSAGPIDHCYSTSNVTGHQDVGGLVGGNGDSNICNSYSIGNVVGHNYVGGLTGYNSGTLSNCYSTDDIISGDDSTYVGGLVGYNSDGPIIKCYSAGVITAGDDSFDIGGLVGESVRREEIIENQCNLVMVCDGDENCWFEEECTDVLVGFEYVEDTSFVQFSFWDVEISGIYDSPGGECKTTVQMHDVNMYLSAGWDFANEAANGADDIWTMFAGQYPCLAWQCPIVGDITAPYGVEITDLQILAEYWLWADCSDVCEGADLTGDGIVDMDDLALLAQHWLETNILGTTVAVPYVIAMSYTDAEAAINAAGLVMGDLNFIFSETVVEWDIISQIPAAGTAAYPSTFVDLVVSRGPDVVIVPDVVGMTEMDAESEIYGAWPYTGTTINFHYSYSDTIAEGYLISQNPAAGSSVPHESSVDIEVSLGPLATVPGVVGMTQADAEVAITAAGLTVGMTQVDAEAAIVAAGLVVGPADAYYSDSVAEGYVINQYPAAGTKVSYDPEVILDISLGPEPE